MTDEWPRTGSHRAATRPPVTAATRRDAPGGVGYGRAAREPTDGERRRRVARGPEGDGDASGDAAVVASGHDRGDARMGASRGGEKRPRGAAYREGDVSGEQHGARGCCSEWRRTASIFILSASLNLWLCDFNSGRLLLLLTPPKMERLLPRTGNTSEARDASRRARVRASRSALA